MASVSRTAGAAGTITLTTRNSAGQLIVPVSAPVVRWYTDAARTLGELTLPVTGSGSSYIASWTAAQSPPTAANRYLKVTIEVSAGVFDVDADDDIGFVDAQSTIGDLRIYATVAEARARGVNTTSVPLDSELDTWLEEASRVVDNYTRTRFGVTAPSTETFDNPGGFILLPYPFSNVTSVTVDGVVQASTAYTVQAYGIRFAWRPSAPVTVTGTFGYPDIPSPVRLATIFIADTLISQSQYRPTVTTDSEGNAGLPTAGYVPRFAANGIDSTGTVRADRLLAPYRVYEGVA